jgi:hypothetical protein
MNLTSNKKQGSPNNECWMGRLTNFWFSILNFLFLVSCFFLYSRIRKMLGKKKAFDFSKAFLIKGRQRLTLPGVIQVPSALTGLTSLFGMGRGDPRRYSHLKLVVMFAD